MGASKIVKAQGVSRATLYQYLALGDDLTRATAGRERPRQSACASLFIGRLGLGVSPHRQGATCVTPLAGERDRERETTALGRQDMRLAADLVKYRGANSGDLAPARSPAATAESDGKPEIQVIRLGARRRGTPGVVSNRRVGRSDASLEADARPCT